MDGQLTMDGRRKMDLPPRLMERAMLSSRRLSGPADEQGGSSMDFAELRRHLANPSEMTDTDRQRLLGLARRLARVRAAGGEYHRVDLSVHARTILLNATASA